MTDFSRYNPPGVYTEVIAGPLVGVQSATPTSVGIFGEGRGYRIDLQTITVPADFVDPDDSSITAVPTVALRQLGISPLTITVINAGSGVAYEVQTVTSPPNGDFEVISTPGPSGVTNGADSTVTLKRVIGGTLDDETDITVSYQYTDPTYFTPQRFYDYDDVVDFYGSPFDTSGSIVSPLTLAANLAFINGAETVITVASKPSSGSMSPSDHTAALTKLNGIADVSVVVPAVSDSSAFSAVRDHVIAQSNEKTERRAILGTDGSVTTFSSSDRMAAAAAVKSPRIAMVAPSTVKYYNSQIAQIQTIGAQYLAAALAGLAVSASPAIPLTRKAVLGFVGIESLSEAQKSQETSAGLLVIESASGGALRVRHGVTTDPSNLLAREWTILGQQDAMSYRLRSFFESDGLIGSIITDTTLANVKTSSMSALESLVSDGVIQGYDALKARQRTENLDIIEISFEWKPSLPLNYIVVRFTLNVSSGDVASTSI